MDNNDLILREEATSTIKSMLYQTAINSVESDEKAAQLYEDIADNRIETWLKLVGSVDAAPVIHGHWTRIHVKGKDYGKVYYQHENCAPLLFESPYHYCPHCGAKLDEQGKDVYTNE